MVVMPSFDDQSIAKIDGGTMWRGGEGKCRKTLAKPLK